MTESYPLAALQQIRSDELEAAKQNYAAAVAHIETCQQALSEYDAILSQHDAKVRAERERFQADAAVDIGEIQRRQGYLHGLAAERERLEARRAAALEQLRAAELDAEKCRTELAEARKEYEALERHYRSWKEEQMLIAQRKSEAEDDERSAAEFVRKKRS